MAEPSEAARAAAEWICGYLGLYTDFNESAITEFVQQAIDSATAEVREENAELKKHLKSICNEFHVYWNDESGCIDGVLDACLAAKKYLHELEQGNGQSSG